MVAFQKRHYDAIASALGKLTEHKDDEHKVSLYSVTREIADAFEADNPAFNRHKFYARVFANDPSLRKVTPRALEPAINWKVRNE